MPYLAHTGLEKWVSKRFEFRLNKHLFNSRDYAVLNFVRSAGMYSLLIQSFDRRVKRQILKALVEGKPRGLEGRRGKAALRHLQGDRTTRLSPWYNRKRSPIR